MHHASDLGGRLTKSYDAELQGDAAGFVVTLTISGRVPVIAAYSSAGGSFQISDFERLEPWQAAEAVDAMADALAYFRGQL